MDTTNLSTQQKIQEWYKCKNDPIYFMENYVQLQEAGGNIFFNLYEPQKKFLTSLHEDHHVISLKSRQIGISTITQGFVTHVYTFYENVVAGIVSRSGEEATDFARKVMSMIDNLPDWLRPEYDKRTEQTFILTNGCKFFSSQVNPKNPSGLFRGKSLNIAIIDEAAHIDMIDEAFTGFGPTLVKAQKSAKRKGVPYGTIIISTPNKTMGIGKWFYTKWKDAETNPDSIYVPHKIHWTDVAEFKNDPDWYKTQCQILHNDKGKIDQELEMKFLASTKSFFSAETIEILNEVAKKPVATMRLQGNDLKLWDRPGSSRFVMISVDTAPAAGKDLSVIEIMDFVDFCQVGEYVGKLRVDDFCKVIDQINMIYPKNIIIVENNSYGNQVVEHLTKTRSNHNIYKQKIHNVEYAAHARYRYGLSNNAQTRPLIIDSLYTYVTENPGLVRSNYLAYELIGLEERIAGSNTRVEAAKGAHDDAAMALGFSAYVRMYDPPLNVSTIASAGIVEDIIDTIDSNFSTSQTSSELTGLKYEEESHQNRTNLALQKHIKSNLHKIVGESGQATIDIHKLLGFQTVTSDRSNDVRTISPRNF